MEEHQHKNLLAVAIGLGLIVLIAVFTVGRPLLSKNKQDANKNGNSAQQTQKGPQMSTDALLTKIHNREEPIIFDIRTPGEFSLEHILDSRNASPASISSFVGTLDKDRLYIVIGESSSNNDSLDVVNDVFAANDFHNAFALSGGFSAWKNGGGPTISTGDTKSFVDQAKVTLITSDQLKDMIGSGEDLFIIDVRKKDAFAAGHIKGAVNIYLDDLERKREEVPVSKKIVVYDKDGLWAFQGAVRLFDMNFFNTVALSDGLDTWTNKNYEIVK